MPAWWIAAIGVQYAIVTALLMKDGQPWLGVAFLGYTLGNVGLTMVALGHK